LQLPGTCTGRLGRGQALQVAGVADGGGCGRESDGCGRRGGRGERGGGPSDGQGGRRRRTGADGGVGGGGLKEASCVFSLCPFFWENNLHSGQ